MADLRFSFPPAETADLVFGRPDPSIVPQYDVTLAATLPGLTFSAKNIPDAKASIAATLPGLSLSASAAYESRAARPTTANTVAAHQNASHQSIGAEGRHQYAVHLPSGAAPKWQSAMHLSTLTDAAHQDAIRTRNDTTQAFQAAQRLAAADITAQHQDAIRIKIDRASMFQAAIRTDANATTARHQDGLRHARRYAVTDFQAAVKSGATRTSKARAGKDLLKVFFGRFQEAIAPGIGAWVPPEPPGPEPCYTPSAHLRFSFVRNTDGNLVFVCDRGQAPDPSATLVIPVRSVYMITNRSTSLVLANTGQPLEATDMRVAIDADSWAWSWSATVPAAYLPILSAEYGGTVDVVATIAGVDFVLSVERIARSRRFGQSTLSVSGRSRAAQLASPYAPEKTTANASASTAQQLMASALTENGVSLGWSLDWQITDWLVPGGVWSHYGTPIDACVEIAGAAGAYIQSHRTQQTLRVLPRYPVAPWAWADVTPDIELPESVVTLEGIEYMDKADYNAVFVSGQASGINAHVTRAGGGGNRPAPMVSHPLITHADAGRQRGLSILGDTGRQRLITLSLPVLQETGVIQPGAMIRYVEQGRTHTGIARAVSVSDSFPKATQQVSIESHDF